MQQDLIDHAHGLPRGGYQMNANGNGETGLDDSELVCRAQTGDQSAFSELVRRHQPASLRLARTILRNWEDAEDEVQNAMCKAFEHLRQFEHQALFSTWLHRIVLNQCFMRLRQLRRQSAQSIDSNPSIDFKHDALPPPVIAESPENKIARQQLFQILDREVNHLPPAFRSVLVLRDIRELPMHSVAKELGITISALKSRRARARCELKARLERRYGDKTAIRPA